VVHAALLVETAIVLTSADSVPDVWQNAVVAACAYVRHPNQALHAGQYALYHMLCPAQHCAALHTSSHGLQGLYGVGAAGAVGLALTQVAISFPFLFSRN